MSTSWEKVYEAFFDKIEKDSDFFNYHNVSIDEALELAKSRAKAYIKESVSKFLLHCTPDIGFTYNEIDQVFDADLTDIEIDILANLMREKYFEKDLTLLKAFQVRFSSKDLNVFSPANERKTFIDMWNLIIKENLQSINHYAARDRITGRFKTIDYSKYSSE